MLPQSQQRKPKNSSKSNLIISFVFHAVLVIVILYFAAREGLLGKKLETLSVNLVKEKPKPPEKPPEPPKVVEPPKIVEPPKVAETPKPSAPPPAELPATVAPPPAELPGLDFGGGRDVESADPVHLYKDYMERTLKAKWDKPDGMDDDNYVVEMGVTVDKDGRLGAPVLQKSSGNEQWDDTVKQVFNVVKNFDRPPPTNFPTAVTIRFDVQLEPVDSFLQ